MRKIQLFSYLLIVILIPILLSGQPTAAAPAAQGANLLRNPGFEGGFFAWSGIPEVQVAHEWTPWWIEDTNRDPRWHRPEWKRALARDFPNRVLGGESAQQYFTFYASHYAGMYQQVSNVTPGKTYRFSLWVQLWSSQEDNPYESELPANPHLQIGIDPTGDARPGFANSPSTVVWSGEAPMDAIVDRWGLMTVDVTAQNSTITVYVRSTPEFANKHNDIYLDEAALVELGPAPTNTAPPPPPTNTPAPATATSEAPPVTPTTAATAVPPTNTPLPTSAATLTPEASPTVAATATLSATATVAATETIAPTATATATTTPTVPPTATATATEEATAEPTIDVTAALEVQATEIAATTAAEQATAVVVAQNAVEATAVSATNEALTLPTSTPLAPSNDGGTTGNNWLPLLIGLGLGVLATVVVIGVVVFLRR